MNSRTDDRDGRSQSEPAAQQAAEQASAGGELAGRENAARRIAENWNRVVDAASEAAIAAGRSPQSVRIVGVAKYVDAATTRHLVTAGCHDLGESRPQSLWQKSGQLSDPQIRWHLIGHLQRNKVRRTVPLVSLVHSVDSPRLAEAINAEAEASGREMHGLLEVNISGDTAKHGFAAEAIPRAIDAAGQLSHLRIIGMMTMAGRGSDASEARRSFEALRQLRDQTAERGLPENVTLEDLSMGMSGDFAEAIAAGATIVRIGSRLFEGLS